MMVFLLLCCLALTGLIALYRVLDPKASQMKEENDTTDSEDRPLNIEE